ncbi:hypothetical protein [Kistimonas asteriae]|uniref:hypothetical protein n=1 Tax=Kistimonas asteriae TaxID=517724 RepID=UPI001BA7B51B|nr:hypothetical protein [Kistimonas asteriae]
MSRFFPSEIFIGDTIERSFQVKQAGAAVDISSDTWTLYIKLNPNAPDSEALITTSAAPYAEGFGNGKARFGTDSSQLNPTTYWFFVRRDVAGVRDTIVAEQVRMVNR